MKAVDLLQNCPGHWKSVDEIVVRISLLANSIYRTLVKSPLPFWVAKQVIEEVCHPVTSVCQVLRESPSCSP